MISFWEQKSFGIYDHVVVGAGITGLSAAIELKQKFPNERILILERGYLPSGASTRNAGFACMGSATELLDDLKTMDEAEVFSLYKMRVDGLKKLRNRLGDKNISYVQHGSYELINEEDLGNLDKLAYLNNLLIDITKKPAFALANKINENGFSDQYVKAMIENTQEGELNTGEMMKSLTNFALQLGIEIKNGAEVVHFNDLNNRVEVLLRTSEINSENHTIQCRSLLFCTNAFIKQFFPDEDVQPGRGQVIVTNPIPGLAFKGVYHFDKGYYYFREIEGRILFGGGRNLDFETENTTEFGLNEKINNDLENKLRQIIIPYQDFSIDYRWSGIMAFGSTRFPIIKAFSENVFGAFRLGGMGVALGSEVGAKAAEMIEERMR